MRRILEAIGWKPGVGPKLALIALFAVTVGFFVGTKWAIGAMLGVPPIVVHLFAWLLWFGWLGFLFPKRRRKHVEQAGEAAYARAFWTDILFGVSFGISQITAPIYYTAIPDGVSVWAYPGAVGILVGSALLYMGVTTLGIDAAGFVFEYRAIEPPRLATSGIYSYFHHPMFFGGILLSTGLALVAVSRTGLLLAAVNCGIYPVYKYLENRRLSVVYSEKYSEYQMATPSILDAIFRRLD